ncbi:MAG: hypothetical protein KAX31_07330 [Thermoplasmata archaeon]|nr:hypothetical protein [Thermoplasmata archaeon]
MMVKIRQYHLKVKHEEAWKLIQHIRFLHNSRYLKQVSHEGVEGEDTYVCIIIRDRLSQEKHDIIKSNLDSLGLVMI